MKKIISFVVAGLACVTACGAVALGGCAEKYTPDAEHYFEINNVYRIIELESESTEHIEDYGLNSLILPTSDSFKEMVVEVDSAFVKGSMFFDNAGALNEDGAYSVYDCLDIQPVMVGETVYSCLCTGLYTFNIKTEYVTKLHITFPLDTEDSHNLIGQIADVDVYTFKYRDVAKDGTEKGGGTFRVFIASADSYIGRFYLKA